jgi:hypothetical protein
VFGRIWDLSKFVAAESFPRRRGIGRRVLEVLLFVLLVMVWPLFPTLESSVWRVFKRAETLGETSPDDAVAVVRDVFAQLCAAERAGRLSSPVARVEIAPFGRFSWMAPYEVGRFLYGSEMALANYEAAADVAASLPPGADTIRLRIDALLKAGRQSDAIRVLEDNLSLDDRRGSLRQRLASLTGGRRRGLN